MMTAKVSYFEHFPNALFHDLFATGLGLYLILEKTDDPKCFDTKNTVLSISFPIRTTRKVFVIFLSESLKLKLINGQKIVFFWFITYDIYYTH